MTLRHLRTRRNWGFQACCLQQEINHLIARDSNVGPTHPPRWTSKARRVRRHKGSDQVLQLKQIENSVTSMSFSCVLSCLSRHHRAVKGHCALVGLGCWTVANPFYYDVLMGMALVQRAIGLRVTDQLLLVLAWEAVWGKVNCLCTIFTHWQRDIWTATPQVNQTKSKCNLPHVQFLTSSFPFMFLTSLLPVSNNGGISLARFQRAT